ncbi:MAG: sulfatase-like hydrolase/transferase, partial [Acidimicrobiia bacterium]
QGTPAASRSARVLVSDTAIVYGHLVFPTRARWRLPPINTQWGNFAGAEVETGDAGAYETSYAISSRGEERAIAAGRFLDGFSADEDPTLHYLHIDFPHGPWAFEPSGQRYAFADWLGIDTTTDIWTDDETYVQMGYERYRRQLQYADMIVGETLDRMESLGLLDGSMMVVTSDHGSAFVPGEPHRAITSATEGSILGIPLLIKYPEQSTPSSTDMNVETVDVLPTMLAALGGTLVEPVDGASLYGATASEGPKVYFSSGGTRIEMTDSEYGRVLDSAVGQLDELGGPHAAIGPRPDLVGRDVNELPIRTVEGSVTFWDNGDEDLYTVVRPIPAWSAVNIRADIVSNSEASSQVYAVVVDGLIATTTTAYEASGGGARIGALLSSADLSAGPVVVEIMRVEGTQATPSLTRFTG